MVKVSSIFSWLGGIAQISSAWGVCLYFYIGAKQSYAHQNLWWLILIAIAYTIIGIIVLVCRDKAVAAGEHVLAWAIVTLLFISFLGGIFTLGVEDSSSSYRPKRYYPKTSQSVETPKPVEEPEFIYVNPSAENQIKKGDFVKVKEGFYVSSIGQRVNSEEVCEVVNVSESGVTIAINHSNSFFNATTSSDNLTLKIKNPKFVQKQEEKEQDSSSKEESKESGQNNDKFEEIKKYKELLDLNIITQEEFDQKKKELLG